MLLGSCLVPLGSGRRVDGGSAFRRCSLFDPSRVALPAPLPGPAEPRARGSLDRLQRCLPSCLPARWARSGVAPRTTSAVATTHAGGSNEHAQHCFGGEGAVAMLRGVARQPRLARQRPQPRHCGTEGGALRGFFSLLVFRRGLLGLPGAAASCSSGQRPGPRGPRSRSKRATQPLSGSSKPWPP